ncbi:Asp-tRNA(Asn)/Glu-tRNA(Gln) amidotransferase subunit GatA [Calderihabitans maritimus]|uniref:Glutamyl-tRNA(Gln) amidotransferase subunit A n=1 Tax=Calderihabitans maritimus TaxID=1246530 RepID=A0A1Z5HQ95_9FIRM|nr:Asp-tRNA(Asn)/Glu-tRNA(Gln) amidotransferase subunit GatA [Calderihabitans maritimus]GAW91608.1 aspartyl/glutamyl-tRNA amidotransferase subunit A [Calderihabitans maritimus]
MNLYELTAHELHELLQKKEVSSREITQSVLERIEEVDDSVKAYVTLTKEKALQQADKVDKSLASGETLGPLAGIPMGFKDNICTKGIKTTCSSKILENFVPPYNATVVERLEEAGAICLGKLNMDEFAMGSSNENSAFFPTRNPWDLDRVPGGSSGGAVAAVAADEAIYTLGSDTGGSIRQPASFCGVVGLKPTYGLVSRFGLVAFASSLDQIGPITKDVTDCALVLQAIAGHDPYDSTSANLPVPDYRQALVPDIKGLRLGIPREYFGEGLDAEVKEAVNQAISKLEELGACCEEVSLPHTEYALPAYYLIAPAEASSNLARYDGVKYGYRTEEAKDTVSMYMKTRREGFGPEVKRRIMLGTYALSSGYYDAYYLKALKVRTLIKRDFDRAFEKYDALIAPTSPTVAFKIGEKANDPLAMYLSDICTIPVNMAGLPAISIPCGFSQGLPVGLQIIGKPFDEVTILRVAYTFEQNTDYHRAKPALEVKR